MNPWALIALGLTLLLLFELLKPSFHSLLERLGRLHTRSASRDGRPIRCLHCRTENDGQYTYCRNCAGRLRSSSPQ